MLAFVLLLSSQTQSQVNLSYAQASSNLVYSNHTSGLIIEGKRIMNSDAPIGDNGHGIFLSFCSNVIIRNCIIGPTSRIGIYLAGCSNITIENCIFFDNSSSITVWGAGNNIKIRNNQFINPQNSVPIGQWGPEGAYVQFRQSGGSGHEVKDNVGENILGFGNPIDLINMAGSYFSSPIMITGNKLRGGGPSQVSGGINVGDLGGSNAIVDNNILVDPGQYGIAIAGGTGYTITNNKIFGRHQNFTNVGLGVWDAYSSGTCSGHTVTNNQVNYTGNWPMYSGTPLYNPFWTDNSCGTLSTAWTDNDFFAPINETILPDRLLAPFPVLHLKLDNDWNDYTGSNLNGTPHGTTLVCDTYRKAAYFDGTVSNWLEFPISPWVKPSSQMITVSAWVKPTSTSSLQGIMRSQDGNGWTTGWRLLLDGSNFSPRVITNNGPVNLTCPGVVAGQWNHVVFTYNGKEMKGYVNGVLKETLPMAGNIIYDGSSLYSIVVGGTNGAPNFLGSIAEVKVWYGNRNATEIANEYSSEIGMFDGTAAGTTQIDATYYANGQSATLSGYNDVQPYSFGEIQVGPNPGPYTWQIVGGSATYFTSSSYAAYVTLSPSELVDLKVTVSPWCALPSSRIITLVGSYWAPLSIGYNPSSKTVTIKEDTPPSSSITLRGAIGRPTIKAPAGVNGIYTVELFNMLGQKLKSAIYKGGMQHIDIGNFINGVYIVRITDGKRIVSSKKIMKMR